MRVRLDRQAGTDQRREDVWQLLPGSAPGTARRCQLLSLPSLWRHLRVVLPAVRLSDGRRRHLPRCQRPTPVLSLPCSRFAGRRGPCTFRLRNSAQTVLEIGPDGCYSWRASSPRGVKPSSVPTSPALLAFVVMLRALLSTLATLRRMLTSPGRACWEPLGFERLCRNVSTPTISRPTASWPSLGPSASWMFETSCPGGRTASASSQARNSSTRCRSPKSPRSDERRVGKDVGSGHS